MNHAQTFSPSFFGIGSPAGSSPPTSWASLPRPRLKRAHSSSAPPAPPANSPQEPLSPALASATLSPQPPFGTTSNSNLSHELLVSNQARIHNNALEIIPEVPQAEVPLVTSRAPTRAPSEPPHAPMTTADESDRPRKSKRRRVAPDHEAFGRLSLNYAPIPSNSRSHPFFVPASSTSPPDRGVASPLTSPTFPSFPCPTVPPTSPDFLPSHPPHLTSMSLSSPISPPSFSPLSSFPTVPSGLPTSGATVEPPVPVSESSAEIEMSRGPSSWDLDPHRIYVASLSASSSDTEEEDLSEFAAARRRQEEQAAETFRINSVATQNHLLPPNLLPPDAIKSTRGHGALILYAPPPTLGGGPKKGENRVERLRREELERLKEEEFRDFRRESERVEREEPGEVLAGSNDEMQMEF
ncbi:uncharacterized protein JCM15063_006343 [Sporobolomyces koalae]|uniref:uncharacterized protein n=1 Tax=Sporobolomyces koalae TaxID=500713 RepID=UPI0031705BB5